MRSRATESTPGQYAEHPNENQFRKYRESRRQYSITFNKFFFISNHFLGYNWGTQNPHHIIPSSQLSERRERESF